MDIDKKAIKEITKEIIKEMNKKKKKEVFLNTKLLMKNYNSLKEHIENAVYDVDGLCEYDVVDISGISEDEKYIVSIRRSKIKTMIMIKHIENSLEVLKNNQKEKGEERKYKALELYYIKNNGYEKIAEILNCGVNTGRRWIEEMIKELSVLLFGIEIIMVETW
nr:MAG TPA: putative RNA polymerase [Caudoviricetes sp.]